MISCQLDSALCSLAVALADLARAKTAALESQSAADKAALDKVAKQIGVIAKDANSNTPQG